VISPSSRGAGAEPQEHPWPHHLAVGAVLLLALLAYSNSFTGAFVFDDVQHVRDNLRIRDLGAYASWSGYQAERHRFVGYLTFAVNYALGKLDVRDYHVVNFLIHAVNCGLVYALVLLGFRTPRLRGSALTPSAQAVAFFAAALFATHPLQTQAVTYVVQRFASLSTLFYVATVVLFLRWRLGDGSRLKRAVLYGALLASAVLGMKTKEIVFTVPLAVVLCELTFFDPVPWRKRLFLAPIAATMAIVPLSYLRYVPAVSPAALGEATRVQTGLSRIDYLLTQTTVLVTYLRMLVWPAGQNLDHDFPIATRIFDLRVLGASVALAVLVAVAVLLYRRTRPGPARVIDPAWRLVALGIVWFFLALSVESSFIPIVDVIYEHRVYLPSIGVFAGVAVAVAFLFRGMHPRFAARAVVATGVLLAVVFGVATFRRNRVWASELTIWSDAVGKSPGKHRPHLNLGTALSMAGRFEEGERELRRAVEIEPADAYSRAQLGAVLVALGRLADAEPQLREAVRVQSRDPEALFNLALVLSRTGRVGEAGPLFRRFLEVAPASYADARKFAEARASRATAEAQR
jgi:hypothetical protein